MDVTTFWLSLKLFLCRNPMEPLVWNAATMHDIDNTMNGCYMAILKACVELDSFA